MIPADPHFAGFAHGYLGEDVALNHHFSNSISIIATIRQQNARVWQIVGHSQIKPQIVGCLPRRDIRPHGQPVGVGAEVDLGREATS